MSSAEHSWKRKLIVLSKPTTLTSTAQSGCTQLALIDLRNDYVKKSATKIRNHYRSYKRNRSFNLDTKASNPEKIGTHGDAQNVLVEGFECNVAEETSVKEVFYDIMRTFGKIDAVIASAGM